MTTEQNRHTHCGIGRRAENRQSGAARRRQPRRLHLGVLDRLLEESRLEFEGITGTSAGAVNAVVLVDGLAAGGREGARGALRAYWQKLSVLSAKSPLAPSFIDKANSSYGLEHSLFTFLQPTIYFASPYQLNPLDFNPLRDLLAQTINFDRVRKQSAVMLFLCATNVQTA